MRMSEALTEERLNELICSLAGFLVKTSAKPESEQELRAHAAAFGLSSPALLGSLDLDTCSLRMSQVCLFTTECVEWSESWPDAGMWDCGSVYELRTLEPVICESESSSWPTARAEDGESCGNHPGKTDSLTGAVKNWPTPNAAIHGPDLARANGERACGGNDLETTASRLWNTPHGTSNRDFRGKVGGCGGGEFAKQHLRVCPDGRVLYFYRDGESRLWNPEVPLSAQESK